MNDDKYYAVDIEFNSPTYGIIDNLKISNALIDIGYSMMDKDFHKYFSDGLKISNLLPLKKSSNSDDELKPFVLPRFVNESALLRYYENKMDDLDAVLLSVRKFSKGDLSVIKDLLKDFFDDSLFEPSEGSIFDNKYDLGFVTKSSINRLTNTVAEGSLFTQPLQWFKGKYRIIFKMRENMFEDIVEAFKLLSIRGLSKKRTIGYGRFSIIGEFKEVMLEEQFDYLYNLKSLLGVDGTYDVFLGNYVFDDGLNEFYDLKSSYYRLEDHPLTGKFKDGFSFGPYLLVSVGDSFKLKDKNSGNLPYRNLFGEYKESRKQSLILAPVIVRV